MKFITILIICLISFFIKAESNYSVDLKTDLPIITTTFVFSYFAPKVVKTVPEPDIDKDDLNFIDRTVVGNYNPDIATYSDYLIGSLIGGVFLLNKLDTSWENYLAESTIMLETFLINNFITTIAKYSVRRPRPYLYRDGATEKELTSMKGNVSFFSGHSSNSFAMATAFATIFSKKFDKTWQKSIIWSVPMLIATTIALMRVEAGKHFYTDIFAGMLVGVSVGYLVPYLHETKKNPIMIGGDSKTVQISFGGSF
ncbi:phosphatase PAP2 family protein [bacterium]|nr:phosphatase PAP2 family protein [bacterium]